MSFDKKYNILVFCSAERIQCHVKLRYCNEGTLFVKSIWVFMNVNGLLSCLSFPLVSRFGPPMAIHIKV